MTVARQAIIDSTTIGVYHCTARCVRRAFLCGVDQYSGEDYEHRKLWIRDRLRLLSRAFAVDVLTYAVMSNHVHVVVRNRPDVAAAWPAEEVARRWEMVFPRRFLGVPAQRVRAQPGVGARGDATGAKGVGTAGIDGGEPRIAVLRDRLCSISWLMKSLNEFIARRANREDECRGRFWEGRFKCQRLLDEAAVLTCMAYVDLNPVRARMAASPADPQFTGAFDRIVSRRARQRLDLLEDAAVIEHSATRRQVALRDEEAARARQSAWLVPFSDRGEHSGPLCGISEESYLELLDWTGRQIRADKPGHIPASLAPLLTRLDIDVTQWVEAVDRYGSLFYRIVGRVEGMIEEAARLGRRFFRGIAGSRQLFTPQLQPT